MEKYVEAVIGGRPLRIETGRLAEQANGAVTVTYGETIVLVTACATKEPREGIDFLPLTVDYEERMYAIGKIPGGYIKREGRPSQEAILTSRLTDRSLRPLFPKGFRNDIQIIATVFSADQENQPDILAIIGASAAISISDIPFAGPIAGVRVGYIDGKLIVNPTNAQLKESTLDLVASGSKDAIIMVEAGANEVPEAIILDALKVAHEAMQQIIALQEELVRAVGKEKLVFVPLETSPELKEAVAAILGDRISEASFSADKAARENALDAIQKELNEKLAGTYGAKAVNTLFEAKVKEVVRSNILNKGIRPDGRDTRTIRPITCEVGVLPRAHGTGLFKRGQTQVLTIATLAGLSDVQIIDGLGPETSRRYMHHYNFPPFSTGEVKRMGSAGRREIGHGALSERALEPMLPSKEEFPYAIRLVSEVLGSNGSSSMGSVCGSTMALLDAGVPLKAPVAGVAMGLVTGTDGKYAILTDIQGMEDALGDMDFKVAGTATGVTAVQMDMKVKGLSFAVLNEALEQANEGRLFILGKVTAAISKARPELSRYAPRMTKIQIPVDKIRNVIGPGGKMIRSIIEETKVSIDIEDNGTVIVGSSSEEAALKAIRIIQNLTKEVEVGTIYTGKVTRVQPFGAFVEILPGKEGLVHISELADYRVPSVEDVVKIG
ncbi:MAG: polyribonucleotide nucleotidyltransferase, partial [Dehalococcoidia bacterium]|nr:polyribonucleotide nucleotidyltransferase [Dehalococcoidia bacterium]